MSSNIMRGKLRADPRHARHIHIPQIQWKCPPEYTLDSNWYVAAGEESTEALTQRRGAPDPRHSTGLCKASENCDSKTPIIPLTPVEEEENLQNNSSAPFLITTAAMNDETLALAKEALSALNACALRQGEQTPIDMGTFMNWLNNSDTVHRYISGQGVPEIEQASLLNKQAQSVSSASSSIPDQLYFNTSDNCVRANSGVVISKPSDWAPWVPSPDTIDMELLVRLLNIPENIEKLNKICAASDRSGNPYTSTRIKAGANRKLHDKAITTNASLLFSRAHTFHQHNSPSITGASSVPKKLMVEDIPLPEATMAPMSPLHASPRATMAPMSPLHASPRATMAQMSPLYASPRVTMAKMSPLYASPRATMAPMSPLYASPKATMAQMSPLYDSSRVTMAPMSPLYDSPRATMAQMSPLYDSSRATMALMSPLYPSPTITMAPMSPLYASLRATMAQMSPLYASPTATIAPMSPLYASSRGESDMKAEYLTTEYGTFADMRNFSSAFGHSTSLMNLSSLQGNTQVVGHGSPVQVKPWKLCKFFNTPKGCQNGTSCQYLHTKSYQA